ncbi:DUF4145 domain-containing protein [Paenibacillus qinlingensis]|uniref:DUF4145 domain-containing protein n=1 Tax=Paenibacillus qinlingensis TaxID=1837343 RepID=UPI0015665465|nr:DUF4145 domain-containing protein [Paenibacillus qinlingensis]NQX63746.1 DUF4145 domain-containing protein [Paenibacillus qinlingensis]
MLFWRQKEGKEIGKRNEELPIPHEGLPDSYRPRGLCPRCGKQSSFETAGSLPVTFDGGVLQRPNGERMATHSDRVISLICRHCNQGVVVIEEEWVGDLPKHKQSSGGTVTYRGIYWWPLPESNLSQDIPSEIADIFSEGVRALFADCPRASVVMLRRTLEAITVDKGESEGTLHKRLQKLTDNGALHPSLTEWVKEVRLAGNIGAHYDPVENITVDAVKELQKFVRELLRYLYEIPADLDRRRKGLQ